MLSYIQPTLSFYQREVARGGRGYYIVNSYGKEYTLVGATNWRAWKHYDFVRNASVEVWESVDYDYKCHVQAHIRQD